MRPLSSKIVPWSCALCSVISLGWGLFIPLYSLILRDFGAGPLEIGFTFLILNLTSAILRFPFGYLADLRGRGIFLLWSCAVGIAASAIAIFASDWLWLSASITLIGISIALYYQSQYSLVADATPAEKLGRVYGVLHALGGVGWLLAPLLTGILLEAEAHALLFLTASFVFAMAILPASRLRRLELRAGLRPSSSNGMLERLGSIWGIGKWLLLAEFLDGVAVGFVQPSLPLYLNEGFALAYFMVGLVVASAGISMLSAQIPGGFLSDRFGGRKIYLVANSLAAPLLLSWSFAGDAFSMTLSVVIYYFVHGLTWVAVDSFLASSTPEGQRTLMLGSAWAMWRLGMALGAGIFGWVWSLIGLRPVFMLASIFFVGSILSFIRFRGFG